MANQNKTTKKVAKPAKATKPAKAAKPTKVAKPAKPAKVVKHASVAKIKPQSKSATSKASKGKKEEPSLVEGIVNKVVTAASKVTKVVQVSTVDQATISAKTPIGEIAITAMSNKKSFYFFIIAAVLSLLAIGMGVTAIANKVLFGHISVFSDSMDGAMQKMNDNRKTMIGLGLVGIIAGVFGLLIMIWFFAKSFYNIKLKIGGKTLTLNKLIALALPIAGAVICSSVAMAFNLNLNDLHGISKLTGEAVTTIKRIFHV